MTDALASAYSVAARSWATGPERIYGRMAELVVAAAPVPVHGRTILDVGAGTGVASRAAVAAGAAAVVAIDAAAGMISHDALSRPPAAVGDALALPFARRSFGGAVAAFSLNHVRDPARGLAEMARVVVAGGPIVASAYAADDGHPVKRAVERALVDEGWTPPPWYIDLRDEVVPLLATVEACRAAVEAALLDAEVRALRVPFPTLSAADLVEWRLGMPHHAPFFLSLDTATRRRVADAALAYLGDRSEPLVRSVLVIAAVSR